MKRLVIEKKFSDFEGVWFGNMEGDQNRISITEQKVTGH